MKNLMVALVCLVVTASASLAKDIKVQSYTKKDGTKVAGYTKTIAEPGTVKVKGYTKKDGTKIKAYVRKKK